AAAHGGAHPPDRRAGTPCRERGMSMPIFTTPDRRWSGRRPRAALVGLATAGLFTSMVVSADLASAVVPTFPDNIVVFPDRDFLSLEGYQNHVGETATIEV